MRHICSWSGGKDSTATILLAHENNEPLDTIIFAEVMFDKSKGISGENPRHIHFVKNVAKPLFESWGYEVLILHSDRDYLDVFNHIITEPKKHMEHKGKKYGFVATGFCSVKRDCKIRAIDQYYKSLKSQKEDFVQYVGICMDEPKRLASMHKDSKKISLLEKYGYTQEMALRKCLEYALLSPGYELSKRGGCWMCPYSRLAEHRDIRNIYPEAWERFVALESEPNLAFNKWNVYGETLEEREKILSEECCYRQMHIFDFIGTK